MAKRMICLSAIALVLAACASTPEPEEIVEVAEPVEEVVEEPVEVAPPVMETTPSLPVAQPPDLPVPGSVDDFAYQSGGEPRVFFAFDQYDLSSDARDVLRRQAQWLATYGNTTAIIEGHADERGTREYNLALGARRADAVKGFLVSQGISPRRLTTVSYGKERPIDGRSNEDGWARNRNGFTNITAGAIG